MRYLANLFVDKEKAQPVRQPFVVLAIGLVLQLVTGADAGVTIDFRYGDDPELFIDSTGFFDDAARKTLLDTAGAYVSSLLGDQLTAIPASDLENVENIWQASFQNPSNPLSELLTTLELEVPEDTLVIFVAGRTFADSSTLATADHGKTLPFKTSSVFEDLLDSRGQMGALGTTPTDYGPWGGSIAFNIDRSWSFASPGESPGSGTDDFFTAAVHEIAHVLGIGTAASWNVLIDPIDSTLFTGSASMDVFGGAVPLATGDTDHFANSGIDPEPLMDPDLSTGQRKFLTELDLAALRDIGWEVTENAMAFLALNGGAIVSGVAANPDTGSVSLSGTLEIELQQGFVPSFGELFPVVTAATRDENVFDQINGVLPAGGDFALAPVYDHQGSTGLTLIAALPGDANLDGEVNGDDINIFFANNGTNGDWSQANLDGDSDVDLDDLEIILRNLGRTAVMQVPSSSPAAVPVPATATILGLGLFAFMRRRCVPGPL